MQSILQSFISLFLTYKITIIHSSAHFMMVEMSFVTKQINCKHIESLTFNSAELFISVGSYYLESEMLFYLMCILDPQMWIHRGLTISLMVVQINFI